MTKWYAAATKRILALALLAGLLTPSSLAARPKNAYEAEALEAPAPELSPGAAASVPGALSEVDAGDDDDLAIDVVKHAAGEDDDEIDGIEDAEKETDGEGLSSISAHTSRKTQVEPAFLQSAAAIGAEDETPDFAKCKKLAEELMGSKSWMVPRFWEDLAANVYALKAKGTVKKRGIVHTVSGGHLGSAPVQVHWVQIYLQLRRLRDIAGEIRSSLAMLKGEESPTPTEFSNGETVDDGVGGVGEHLSDAVDPWMLPSMDASMPATMKLITDIAEDTLAKTYADYKYAQLFQDYWSYGPGSSWGDTPPVKKIPYLEPVTPLSLMNDIFAPIVELKGDIASLNTLMELCLSVEGQRRESYKAALVNLKAWIDDISLLADTDPPTKYRWLAPSPRQSSGVGRGGGLG